MFELDEQISFTFEPCCPYCGCNDLKLLDFGERIAEFECCNCESTFILDENGELFEQENLDDY